MTTEIPAAEVLRIFESVRSCGWDLPALLRRARSPFGFEDFTQGRVQMVPVSIYAAIYREYVLALEIEASSKSGRPPVTQEEFGMLWCSVMTCATLAAAIDRIAAFSAMLGGRMGAVSVELSDNHAYFRLDSLRPSQTPSSFITEAIGLVMYDRMLSWLIGEPLEVQEIELNYPPEFARHLDASFVSIPVRLDQGRSGFRFPISLLERPLVRRPEELEAMLPLTILSVGTHLDGEDLSRRVLHLFEEALVRNGPLPNTSELSAKLRCSPASLRRKLSAEGNSIQALKDRTRLDWARELLRQPGMTISDIASRLSFSDETAFRRAFRQWTGQRPSAFRPQSTRGDRARPNPA
ncbi:helix-turn-helix domain-containing protein [Sphingobium sp. WCS2017Hpa-17]|uniref:helix-turn-helix domain-containing protein n=1 Tax=Sphingobium sp. WCS2017Hpa-17 TaxID=3073638 RepID=UPI002889F2C7|nr:helix-turn-helix domain-containing protein [Sphingobium sp. WCS2017Hpa-17]